MQTPAPHALDARASDPVTMGWMVGSPPPPDKMIRFADGSWFRFPQSRWSYSHVRQLLPTSVVRRGNGPVSALARDERKDVDAVTFTPIGRTETTDLGAIAGCQLHGRHRHPASRPPIYERYFGVLTPERQHLAFSVSKSFVATLAATLIVEGMLDDARTVAHYVPELGPSGIGDATIRQLLDMTTGLTYAEDYVAVDSAAWQLSRAGGFLARPDGYTGPQSFFEYFRTLTKSGPHGDKIPYKTVNTDVLGAVLRRVSGESLSDLLSEEFSQARAEHDAFFAVDSTGAEFAGAALNLTLRDLARFGEMMRLDGRFNGQQIVPKAVVDDTRRGSDSPVLHKPATRHYPAGVIETCGGFRTTSTVPTRLAAFTDRLSISTRKPRW